MSIKKIISFFKDAPAPYLKAIAYHPLKLNTMYAIQNTENHKWVVSLNPFVEKSESAFSLNQKLVEGTEEYLEPIVDALNVPVAGRFGIGASPRPH